MSNGHGFVKIELIKGGGVSVQTRLHEIGVFEKAAILDGVFTALGFDLENTNEIAMFCGMANLIHSHSERVAVDTDTIQKAAEKMHGQEADADEE